MQFKEKVPGAPETGQKVMFITPERTSVLECTEAIIITIIIFIITIIIIIIIIGDVDHSREDFSLGVH